MGFPLKMFVITPALADSSVKKKSLFRSGFLFIITLKKDVHYVFIKQNVKIMISTGAF